MQVLLNILIGMTAQEAIDAARFCIDAEETSSTGLSEAVERISSRIGQPSRIASAIDIEAVIGTESLGKLEEMGHGIRELSGYGREKCGRGQIIQKIPQEVRSLSRLSEVR